MIGLATRYTDGVEQIIAAHDLPWSVAQLGARAEYRFCRPAPRNGAESEAATDEALEDYLHVFLVNRDILLTPFHNMALMCPATTVADVDRHLEVLDAAVVALVGSSIKGRGSGR
jgi:glutamate-1-semialdehyde 2,1-aminomutase